MLASGVTIFPGFGVFSSVLWRLPSPLPAPFTWWAWFGKRENRAAVSQMLGTLGPLDFPGFPKAHFEHFRALSIRRPLRP